MSQGPSAVIETKRLSGVPPRPGLYAMYGGDPPRTWIAYVGITNNIQHRMLQHFYRRDSSLVTETSAAGGAPNLWSMANRLTDLEERVAELQKLLADRPPM